MNKLFIIGLLLSLAIAQTAQIAKCECTQLLSESDCGKKSTCSWDKTKSTCSVATVTPPQEVKFPAYCDSFNQADCPKTVGCMWTNSKCTHFTGCTAFAKTTDPDCQAISIKCITDGTHCVEVAACEDFALQLPCVINNLGKDCYWNTADKKCVTATTCDQYSALLTTDAQCRDRNKTCTVKATGGGCQDSGTLCSDQTLESQCYWDKTKNQPCFWDSTAQKCQDRTCALAPSSYNTNEQCKQHLPTCTAKKDGGCTIRTTCQSALIAEGCKTDANNNACYWTGTACVNKDCAAAPNTINTNALCEQFVSGCITKNGGGCKQNTTSCGAADTDLACVQTINGSPCVWSGTPTASCKEKNCSNAPATYNTFDKCTQYLKTCTVATSGNGCTDRTCKNAPDSYKLNSDCESYKSGCITTGSGCTPNGECQSITYPAACEKNAQGKPCLYDGGVCKDKTCENAPADSRGSHTACNTYLPTCTVNANGDGCIDFVCENIQSDTACAKDKNGTQCVWKAKCYTKQCKTAPQTITTHLGCQNYLQTCTVDNTGSGCMTIPLACSLISSSEGCQTRVGGFCYWASGRCQDRTCALAPSTYATTTDCNSFLSGCMVNNTGNGCVDPAKTKCADRVSNNCEVSGGYTCLSDSVSTCVEKTCDTAKRTTITTVGGYIQSFSNNSCNTYLTGCILNNDGSGCMAKSAKCSEYGSSNCNSVTKIDGSKCYYNGTQCVDRTCINLKENSHDDCQTQLDTCTVATTPPGCVNLAAACTGYQKESQCVKTASGANCIWANNACRSAACSDAGDTSDYQTHQLCNDFVSTCTVLERVEQKGCTAAKANCSDYLVEYQCYKNTSGADCFWNKDVCILKSSLTCEAIKLDTYSTANCENKDKHCKINGTNNGCMKKVCADYSNVEGVTSGTDLTTADQCSALDSTCTIDNGSSKKCMTLPDACAGNSEASCSYSKQGKCAYAASACSYTPACADKSGTDLTYATCQSFDPTCTANLGGTACLTRADACSGFDTQPKCRKSGAGLCKWASSACAAVTTLVCSEIVGVANDAVLSYAICQDFSSTCSVSVNKLACVTKANCSTYSQANCYQGLDGMCFYKDSACVPIATSSDCAKVTGTANSLNYGKCQAYNTACGVNADGSACEAKSCTNASNASLEDYTDAKCSGYLSTCTANKASSPDACTAKLATCSLSTTSDTCVAANDGGCIWIAGSSGGQCVKKTCSNSPVSLTTASGCQGYLSSCTLAKIGGCTPLTSCNQYYSSDQCKVNSSGNKCFWNAKVSLTCVDLQCAQIESAYNTHTLCSGISGIKCTSNNTGKGCMNIGSCSTYKTSDNCQVSTTGKCVWYADTTTCVDQTCATATVSTDSECKSYIEYSKPAERCTAAVALEEGVKTLKGCQLVAACATYQLEGQCVVNAEGKDCAWNSSTEQCADKSCLTAPASEAFDTDEECIDYLDDGSCTVASSGQGCIVRPEKCEDLSIEAQCVKNKAGSLCYWNATDGKCYTKSCSTAPSDLDTADKCAEYFQGCTLDTNVKCKIQVCEDFIYTTDTECEKAKPGCTTNGFNCVTRTKCVGALVQAACVTQSDGLQCEWLKTTKNCVLKTCATASTDLVTEIDCSNYFPGCTTKSGGGCVTKTTCTAATVEAACKTDVNKTVCVWDNGKCRYQTCSDFSGSSHADCQTKLQKGTCTIGTGGKCAAITTCTKTTVREACISDVNGSPCLWISGACYNYTSCKSQIWTDDKVCKAISNQCTTNGTNCIAITSCSETNINGGCKTGYDGNCIQTPPALNASPAVCKIFTACTDAFYNTHDGCQTASSQCTTNGQTCAPLGACSTYQIKEACHFSATGAVVDSATGAVTSTGECAWDETLSQCRDQKCIDFKEITTHSGCVTKLQGCTTDGANCIAQASCSTYTQASCENAYGTDGPQGKCKWDATLTPPACRIFACSDIASGTTTDTCQKGLSSCVSDGTKCISKAACNSYTTKTACNSSGTDGVCVFTAGATGSAAGTGTCKLMASCGDASNDQIACEKEAIKPKCAWTSASGTGTTAKPSSCATHNCTTFYQTNKYCGNFYNYAGTLQQVCQTVNGVCTAFDPSTLKQDACYTATQYAYTWNPTKSQCSVCTNVVVQPNTTTNNTTNPNDTTTTSGYMLGFVSVILGYIVF